MTQEILKADDRVLVTGGAGYVGSHLVRILLERGLHVRVLDNFLYGPEGLEGLESHPRLEVVYGDICNIRDMMRATKDTRVVIALAALVGDGACEIDHDETIAINIESTKLLCQAVKLHPDVERVVFASSCSVYGATEGLVLNEGSKLNPVSFYARSRIVSEGILARELQGRSVAILRLGTVFGASPRPRLDLMVNTMTTRAVVGGKVTVTAGASWRPHVHVADVADAFALIAGAPPSKVTGETFNVGCNANNYTITDVANMVAERVPGTTVEHLDTVDDLRSYRVSFDKIQHVLGFEPKRSIADGIDEVKALLAERASDWEQSKFWNLKHIQTHGFDGERPGTIADSSIGEVA